MNYHNINMHCNYSPYMEIVQNSTINSFAFHPYSIIVSTIVILILKFIHIVAYSSCHLSLLLYGVLHATIYPVYC